MSVESLDTFMEEGRFGGKAAQLHRALAAGLPVPDGLAVSHDAVARADAALFDEIAARIPLAEGVAVRSSAVGEDSAVASFAGQHATVLGVTSRAALEEAFHEVRASADSPAARAYRRKLGIDTAPRIGVVVQRMIDADVAGVLFTRDPVTGDDVRVIEASWGLGESVVAGTVTPDRFRVARGGRVLAREPGEKDRAIRLAPDRRGTVEVAVPAHRVAALCLDDAALAALDALATRCEAYLGRAADIEFAFADGTLRLLQCRAITRG